MSLFEIYQCTPIEAKLHLAEYLKKKKREYENAKKKNKEKNSRKRRIF